MVADPIIRPLPMIVTFGCVRPVGSSGCARKANQEFSSLSVSVVRRDAAPGCSPCWLMMATFFAKVSAIGREVSAACRVANATNITAATRAELVRQLIFEPLTAGGFECSIRPCSSPYVRI
ncbi:hypothetical protein D3C83_15270 [compost metagenome]